MNKAVLDTDTLSEVGKGVDRTVAATATATATATAYRWAFGTYTTSVVSVMEIVRGFRRNQSQRRLETFLASVAMMEVLPFDRHVAELAGRIAGDLERAGDLSAWPIP